MITYYKPKHFTTQELVDKKTYEMFGENSLMFFSTNALIMLDSVREFLDTPIVVNNWNSGGIYQFSGFRAKWVEIGGVYSQHRFGSAFDMKIKAMTIEQAFKKIIDNKDDEKLKLVTTIEDISFTPSWLHIDCRNIPDRLRIVKP
jgi:hypothetical protein